MGWVRGLPHLLYPHRNGWLLMHVPGGDTGTVFWVTRDEELSDLGFGMLQRDTRIT